METSTVTLLFNFNAIGKVPVENEVLNISVTGSASSGVKSFQVRFGTSSGPIDLKEFISDSLLHTLVDLIILVARIVLANKLVIS